MLVFWVFGWFVVVWILEFWVISCLVGFWWILSGGCFAGLGLYWLDLLWALMWFWVLCVGCSFVWLFLGDFAGCRILGRFVWVVTGLGDLGLCFCALRVFVGGLSLYSCASQVLGGFVGLGC